MYRLMGFSFTALAVLGLQFPNTVNRPIMIPLFYRGFRFSDKRENLGLVFTTT